MLASERARTGPLWPCAILWRGSCLQLMCAEEFIAKDGSKVAGAFSAPQAWLFNQVAASGCSPIYFGSEAMSALKERTVCEKFESSCAPSSLFLFRILIMPWEV